MKDTKTFKECCAEVHKWQRKAEAGEMESNFTMEFFISSMSAVVKLGMNNVGKYTFLFGRSDASLYDNAVELSFFRQAVSKWMKKGGEG